jgi:hypothetical protein
VSDTFSPGQVFPLIMAKLPYREVVGAGVSKVHTANRGGGAYHSGFGEREATAFPRLQKIKDKALVRVIRTTGIAKSGTDAYAGFAWVIGPPFPLNPLVQFLGKGFGKGFLKEDGALIG